MGKFIFQMDRHRGEFRKRKVNIFMSIYLYIYVDSYRKSYERDVIILVWI